MNSQTTQIVSLVLHHEPRENQVLNCFLAGKQVRRQEKSGLFNRYVHSAILARPVASRRVFSLGQLLGLNAIDTP